MTVLFFMSFFYASFIISHIFCLSFHSFFLFFIMSFEPKQKQQRISSIIEAKSLLSNEDVEGAFAVLKEAAGNGNVMACFDCGFMMIQGIGCKRDWDGGFELISKGIELEKQSTDMSWKSDGSVSELFEPQSMDLWGLFFLMNIVLNLHISS